LTDWPTETSKCNRKALLLEATMAAAKEDKGARGAQDRLLRRTNRTTTTICLTDAAIKILDSY